MFLNDFIKIYNHNKNFKVSAKIIIFFRNSKTFTFHLGNTIPHVFLKD
ncbi:hypothetical protein HMPREF9419_0409 [Prevotella nigrescens ATCC 33563]|nr:hypothetical protein HMPREF9419_0409 [Prevotella nigrescens ATCC 33563]